jgi:hypothetical protein
MIARWIDPILRPIRELRSKWLAMKNIPDSIKGDVKRLKGEAGRAKKAVGDAKKKALEAKDKAKKAADGAKEQAAKAQGAFGQVGGALGNAKGQVQGFGGMMGGPGAPPMGAGGVGPPGAPGMTAAGAMPGAPGFGSAMGGMPGQPMGGYPGMGMAPQAPPGPGVRTMAIMAGGNSGLAAIGWLVPLKGPHRGQLITLKPNSVIGKDPTCEVCINDAFMSSRHATIRVQNGLFVLEDHSTNGTVVNDRPVKRHELVDSDIVKMGQTLMKFKAL